MQLDQQSAT